MKKLFLLLLFVWPLSSCNTTGDPMIGGFFANDAAYAQQTYQKEAHVRALRNENARLRRSY